MREEGFSDLHQHVLWGLDDGPQTPEQMRALLAQNDTGVWCVRPAGRWKRGRNTG